MDTDIQDKILEQMQRTGSLYFEWVQSVFEPGQESSKDNWEKMVRQLSDNVFGAFHEIAGKYLKAPPLGIYREVIQQLMETVDVQHQFTAEINDFFVKLSQPLGKSLKALDKVFKSKDASNLSFKTPQEVYDFLSKCLEKEYDTYLKSPEGVQDVAELIHGYVAYREKVDGVKDVWLKSLSIPTTSEMADVYKSIYELKKKVRTQDQQLAEQQLDMKRLSDRIKVLEAGVNVKSGTKNKRDNVSKAQ